MYVMAVHFYLHISTTVFCSVYFRNTCSYDPNLRGYFTFTSLFKRTATNRCYFIDHLKAICPLVFVALIKFCFYKTTSLTKMNLPTEISCHNIRNCVISIYVRRCVRLNILHVEKGLMIMISNI